MTIDYHIETPTLDDAPALAALAQACFSAAFAHLNYPPDDLAAHFAGSMSAARYATEIGDPLSRVRMARDADGALVGFVFTGRNILPLPAGEPPADRIRELHQLYLLPRAQGSGLADRFMADVRADAADHAAAAVYLSVYAQNFRAQRFYARHGFGELCTTTFNVGNTVDDERIWKLAL